jgi:signal peptidase I
MILCAILGHMEQTNVKQSWWDLVKFALIALAIVIPVRVLIAQPFVVSGSSMVPTFTNGDYLIINELAYRIGDPKRFDVVVFRYPGDTTKFFIKRVIGLPNETVNIKGNDVTIINKDHPEGFKLDQPYVKNLGDNNSSYTLKADEYFVMGDNRPASSDSRYWGAVPRNLMVGKPLLRLLPVSHMDLMPGDYKNAEEE